MRLLLWCLPLGVFSAAWLQQLPSLLWLALLLLVALLIGCRFKTLTPLVWLVVGFCYGCLWGYWQLLYVLPVSADKTDYRVTGVILPLPRADAKRVRFELLLDHSDITSKGQALQNHSLPIKKLMLSWYGAQNLRAGERWQLDVRLRSPRGFMNPGNFDYSTWLFRRGISATGYVRSSLDNHRLDSAGHFSIADIRQSLMEAINARQDAERVKAYMKALVLGDKSAIAPAGWDLLKATGTVHLLVVSGLHIGIVAMVCYWLGLFLGHCLVAMGVPIPATFCGRVAAFCGAAIYTLLAGAGLPVLRALIMTTVVIAALLLRRRTDPWQCFGWALTVVALVDPLAVTDAGFWLSFGAVAGLLLWFVPRPKRRFVRQLLEAQIVVFVALAAGLLVFQGQLSLIAPFINLLAIPWLGFIVVPLCLLGALFNTVGFLGPFFWDLAAFQLQWVDIALEAAAVYSDTWFWQPAGAANPWFIVGCLSVALSFVLPAALRLRPLGVVLLAVLTLSRLPHPPPLQLTVLDVGQGLATVVRAGDKTLVYDSGALFSPNFNAGAGIVAPYLRDIGEDNLDMLMVSHGDNDHAGGVPGLMKDYPPKKTLSGTKKLAESLQILPCHQGQSWQWNKVQFFVLWPPLGSQTVKENNRSCVLFIRYGESEILLTGDIERSVEDVLVIKPLTSNKVFDKNSRNDNHPQGLDVLVAPHHGSQTSSSLNFVRWSNPRHVVFSTGFNHHFGHPHQRVIDRYEQVGAQIWNTAYSGAIHFYWDDAGQLFIDEYAEGAKKYWHQR